MPAYRQRITLCPEEDGYPVRVFDFPLWWDRSEFFKKFGSRQVDTGNPFYVDYGLLLASSEAHAWDRRCREVFAQSPHGDKPHNVAAMARLEAALKIAKWVIVESYEWESGLD